MPELNRRRFLTATAGIAAGGLAHAMPARAKDLEGIMNASIRGSINATELGLRADASDDQSRAFSRMIERAAENNTPIFLPPGVYTLSNITLPRRLRLSGVPGATRIAYGGRGFLFRGEGAEHIELEGLLLDGGNNWLSDQVQSILEIRATPRLVVGNCEVIGSARNAIALERCGGRIEDTRISGAGDVGIYSVDAEALRISANTISGCANGGILVHRWQKADDGTIVSENRVTDIGARDGGTGQWGNGINVFRADNVSVSDNHVSGCAFSAVRANSASNIRIASNTCRDSGETAIYSEFTSEGAVINGNVVDGAANGISLVNFDQGGRLSACTGNLVRRLSTKGPYETGAPGFGIGINVEADSSVTGNVIEDAPVFGMSIGWGPFMRNVVATGNMIREAPVGIAVSVVEGAGSAVISDNVIDGATRGAIVGYRWAEPSTDDLAVNGVGGFDNLTIERNQAA